MNMTLEELTNKLKKKKIRLSYQRIKILEYINNHRIHPTVDQIYNDLRKEVPTLSKTTVYNTLNTLADSNLVKVITIGDNEARYDVTIKNHGHFKCESCGIIFDFNIDFNSFKIDGLSNFQINQKDIYFKGLCPKCIKKDASE
ncbi:transcriptional repressor [Schnuerera sp. xch1]|uniref:Fur family transcriptional regulator n=1 Tax=Schnuerera sp. xch1 TaxID=2874283 RepID=UPI001CBB9204|nr:Fur family transcriptional regulator [Schnuerera sp. xch1]MBZ2174283.1 transcriptional repressor [Schnuerera sp. xch1]